MLSEMQSSQNKISGMVSFLCLCYNHSKYIKECLESILSQNLPSFEIIVLDDGSTDDSVGILRDFKNAHSCNMRIISQNNTGYIGLNFNRLIAAANGDFSLFEVHRPLTAWLLLMRSTGSRARELQ